MKQKFTGVYIWGINTYQLQFCNLNQFRICVCTHVYPFKHVVNLFKKQKQRDRGIERRQRVWARESSHLFTVQMPAMAKGAVLIRGQGWELGTHLGLPHEWQNPVTRAITAASQVCIGKKLVRNQSWESNLSTVMWDVGFPTVVYTSAPSIIFGYLAK